MKQRIAAVIMTFAFMSVAFSQDNTRYIALVNGGKDKAGHPVTTRKKRTRWVSAFSTIYFLNFIIEFA